MKLHTQNSALNLEYDDGDQISLSLSNKFIK